MHTESNNKKIYIDLDSLMDTRFSMLYNIDKDLLHTIYTNKEYDIRIINQFGYITSNIFNLLFTFRNKSILNISYFTKIFAILNVEIANLKQSLQLIDISQPITIDINTYPYILDTKEKENILKVLSTLMDTTSVSINIIYINIKQLLPSYVITEYISMIMYNGMEWFNYMLNTDKFFNNQMPNTNLIVPALMHNPVVLKNITAYENMFEDIRKQSELFINLKFTPVEYFNVKI